MIPHPDNIPAHVPYNGRTPAGAIRFKLPPPSNTCPQCQSHIPPPISTHGGIKVFCKPACLRRWKRQMLIDMGWCTECARHPVESGSRVCENCKAKCKARYVPRPPRISTKPKSSQQPEPDMPPDDIVYCDPQFTKQEIQRIISLNSHSHLRPDDSPFPDYWERNRPPMEPEDEDDEDDTEDEREDDDLNVISIPRKLVQSGLSLKQAGLLMQGIRPTFNWER